MFQSKIKNPLLKQVGVKQEKTPIGKNDKKINITIIMAT